MHQKTFKIIFALTATLCIIEACSKFEPTGIAEEELLDGPVEGLTNEQRRQFLAGDIAFNDEVFTASTGLGPVFVAASCGNCHAGDGKGHPSTTLIRFGQSDTTGNHYMHLGGPQLQNNALAGFLPEQVPAGATFSKFTPPANTGLGFLELVPDAEILAMADPNDANGDGISGVPNFGTLPSFLVPEAGNISVNGRYIHRFGKKAAAFNLLHQAVNAYNQDMGITSSFSPLDVYSGSTIGPEVSNQTVNDVVFYLRTLKAPTRRNPADAEIQRGQNIFLQAGCENCHKQTLRTGNSNIAPLSNTTFHPYTDLLLHDMGAALNDGYTEGSAQPAEWRTPPLWGLGLSTNSQGGQYFLMHDGRARSIEEAIAMHGGEALNVRNNYMQLTPTDKAAVLKFLKSL